MASLYKRKGSPFWWIKFKNPAGEVKQQSTGFRHGIPSEYRKAQLLRNQRSLRELEINKNSAHEAWNLWVPEFLESRHKSSPLTLIRYRNAWHNLEAYLNEIEVVRPRQLTFRHCEEYMKWRPKGYVELGVYPCVHNTARWELKILHRLMKHAIHRGFAAVNPCESLGIGKEETREKPELS